MTAKVGIAGLIGRYFDALRAMDQEAWVGCFAQDGAFRSSEGVAVSGHAALRQLFPLLADACGGCRAEVEQSIDSGSVVAVRWERDSVDGRASGVDVFEIGDDGRIRSVWEFLGAPIDGGRRLEAGGVRVPAVRRRSNEGAGSPRGAHPPTEG